MKIIQQIISSGWGGQEQYVLDLCAHLLREGHDVRMIARDYPHIIRRYADIGVPVTVAPLKKIFDFTSPRRLAAMLAGDEETIIHVHSFRDAAIAIKARRLSRNPNVRIVVSRHIVKPGGRSLLDRHIYRHVDCVLYVSALARDIFFSSNPPIDHAKVHVLHNSIIPGTADPAAAVPHDGVTLMYHGRLVPEKGVDTLIESLPFVSPEATLRIVGGGPDDYVAALRQKAGELGVGDRIVWTGHVDNVHSLIPSADIGVMPSRWREPFGLAAIEYMAHGKPVVTTDNGAQPEYIDDGREGLLVPPDRPDALAEAINRLVADPGLRRQMGLRAAERFERDLSYPVFARHMTEYYRKALDTPAEI